jgi:hypothetical protein
MLSRQEEEAERKAVLENDLQVLRQAGTFFQHGLAQSGELSQGRFAAVAGGAPHVVGSAPLPKYPAAGGHQHDPVGTEPPLNFSVNDMPGSELSADPVTAAEQTGGAAAAPSSAPDVEHAAPPLSEGQDNG